MPVGCDLSSRGSGRVGGFEIRNRGVQVGRAGGDVHRGPKTFHVHQPADLGQTIVGPDWKQKRYAQASTELLEALRPWPDDGLAASVRQAVLGALERLETE